jgi:hypothetical protein
MAFFDCPIKWCHAGLVCHIRIGSVRQEDLNKVLLSGAHGAEERCVAVLVLDIDRTTVLQKKLGKLSSTVPCGTVEHRETVTVSRVRVSTVL